MESTLTSGGTFARTVEPRKAGGFSLRAFEFCGQSFEFELGALFVFGVWSLEFGGHTQHSTAQHNTQSLRWLVLVGADVIYINANLISRFPVIFRLLLALGEGKQQAEAEAATTNG